MTYANFFPEKIEPQKRNNVEILIENLKKNVIELFIFLKLELFSKIFCIKFVKIEGKIEILCEISRTF